MECPFRVTELDHLLLRCRDLPQMVHFYAEKLGLREERRVDAIGLVQLRSGRSLIDLIPSTDVPAETDRPNVDHFCLGIDATDMQGVVHYLKERAVEVIGEPTVRYGAHGYGLSVYLRDPEGNVIELKQAVAERGEDASRLS